MGMDLDLHPAMELTQSPVGNTECSRDKHPHLSSRDRTHHVLPAAPALPAAHTQQFLLLPGVGTAVTVPSPCSTTSCSPCKPFPISPTNPGKPGMSLPKVPFHSSLPASPAGSAPHSPFPFTSHPFQENCWMCDILQTHPNDAQTQHSLPEK